MDGSCNATARLERSGPLLIEMFPRFPIKANFIVSIRNRRIITINTSYSARSLRRWIELMRDHWTIMLYIINPIESESLFLHALKTTVAMNALSQFNLICTQMLSAVMKWNILSSERWSAPISAMRLQIWPNQLFAIQLDGHSCSVSRLTVYSNGISAPTRQISRDYNRHWIVSLTHESWSLILITLNDACCWFCKREPHFGAKNTAFAWNTYLCRLLALRLVSIWRKRVNSR